MAEGQDNQQGNQQGNQPATPTVADTLIREPLMITLPLAIALSTVLWKLPGGVWSDSNLGALVAAFVVSSLVSLADVTTTPPPSWKVFSPWARLLVYVAFNTLLIAGVLTAYISVDTVGQAAGVSVEDTSP
jgi:hypothetical protein